MGCGIVEGKAAQSNVGVDEGTSKNKYKDEYRGSSPFDSAQGQNDKLLYLDSIREFELEVAGQVGEGC